MDSDSFLSEGILSFVEYAPRLLKVLPSRQFLTLKFEIKFYMIVPNYVTGGLNVEEVGYRRESQSPKANSIGHSPMYMELVNSS